METREIQTALVTVSYSDLYMDKLRKTLYPAKIIQLDKGDKRGISEALREADVAILGSEADEQILREGMKLKWIHCDQAGLDSSARIEVFERGILLTGAAGRSGPTLAEHAFYFILSLTYDSKGLMKQQEQGIWGGIPGYGGKKGLYGKTIGIIGMGNTGREVAKRAKAFGMNVLGYSRSSHGVPDCVDEMFCTDQRDSLDEVLRRSDYIVLAVRLTDETHHMINQHTFEIMKKEAYLINMSRGSVIDEEALVQALLNREIAGAGCDTFTEEPLPVDNPLWKLDNIMITPHCTPGMPDTIARSLEIICSNIEHYRQGKPLLNQLNSRDVYTKK